MLADGLSDLNAVHVGHVVVEDDKGEAARGALIGHPGLEAVLALGHLRSVLEDLSSNDGTHGLVVIGEEDVGERGLELVERFTGGTLRGDDLGRRLLVEHGLGSNDVAEDDGEDGRADGDLADVLVDVVSLGRFSYFVKTTAYTPRR